MVEKGSALVTYSSPDEASMAREQLQKTTIEGNRRFIDVLPGDHNGARGGSPMGGKGFPMGGKGYPAMQDRFMAYMGGGKGGYGYGGGKSFGKGGYGGGM